MDPPYFTVERLFGLDFILLSATSSCVNHPCGMSLIGPTGHYLLIECVVLISGGGRGFGEAIWTVKEYVPCGDFPYITLYYHSFDGEQR
jgi:hypothetical protein